MITLYQFPVSHYCEKIRWVLDYKCLDFQVKNLLPGFHHKITRKIAVDSSVPILQDGECIVQGSKDIIDYLDGAYPQKCITPNNAEEKTHALEWETYSDLNVGPQVRLISYHLLLGHPNILIPILTKAGPWYGRFLIKAIYPQLEKKMRRYMGINDESYVKAKSDLLKATENIDGRLQQGTFLVGNTLSRADIATASLLAPLFMPEKYGVPWPRALPHEFQLMLEEFSPRLERVKALYRK